MPGILVYPKSGHVVYRKCSYEPGIHVSVDILSTEQFFSVDFCHCLPGGFQPVDTFFVKLHLKFNLKNMDDDAEDYNFEANTVVPDIEVDNTSAA